MKKCQKYDYNNKKSAKYCEKCGEKLIKDSNNK